MSLMGEPLKQTDPLITIDLHFGFGFMVIKQFGLEDILMAIQFKQYIIVPKILFL